MHGPGRPLDKARESLKPLAHETQTRAAAETCGCQGCRVYGLEIKLEGSVAGRKAGASGSVLVWAQFRFQVRLGSGFVLSDVDPTVTKRLVS